MAMTTCRTCQGEVSSEAVICPQCGATNPDKARSAQPVTLVGCFFWVFLAIVAWGAWYWWPSVSDWWSSVSGGGLAVIETICDDLVPHIVELSKETDRPLRFFQQLDVTARRNLQEFACYEAAYKSWLPLAEQGDADTQLTLGFMYENGVGVPQDVAEAAKWYRRAAEQGHASAQHNLGFMYNNGVGVPQDAAEAAKWFRKAADQGDTGPSPQPDP